PEPACESHRATREAARTAASNLTPWKEVERASGRRHQARFEAVGAAGERDPDAALDQRRSERQRGKDVPSRAAARDQDVEVSTDHPDSRASAMSAPSSASETIIAEPPYDTNGSVRPFVGSAPSATPKLSSPCTTMRAVSPKAKSDPNSSGC